MSSPPRWQLLAAALFTAAAAVLANPTHDIFALSFVAFFPWLFIATRTPPRQAFVYGLATGTAAVVWGFFWMEELLTRFGGLPEAAALPILVGFGALQGLQFALPAAGVSYLRRRWPALPLCLTVPVLWVAAEATLPTIFPMYIAIFWAWKPALIQLADLGGVTMVSGAVLLVNTAGFGVLQGALRRRVAMGPTVTLVASLVLILGYGHLRLRAVDDAVALSPTLAIGIVQGNMSIEEMGRPREVHRVLQKHQRMSAKLEAEGAELVVWGETAYPNSASFGRESVTDLPDNHPWRVRRGFSAPLIFGLVTTDHTGKQIYPWNSALVLGDDDVLGDRYDKVFLLMFGEYTPLVDPDWLRSIVPTAAHLERGAGPTPLHAAGYSFAPLICYEDVLPRYARDAARQETHAFVNLTNDAWFGLSTEPAQHLALSVFRTVEHRKAMVRAVTTGISAFIDPAGRVVRQTKNTDPGVQGPMAADGFVASVPMLSPDGPETLYALTGETFNGLMVFGTLFLLGAARRRPREDALS